MKECYINLFVRLYLIGRKLKAAMQKNNTDRLLELAAFWVVSREKLTVSSLGKALGVKPVAMSERIKRMAGSGYLLVVKNHEDKRGKTVEITPKGKARLNRLLEEVHLRLANCCLMTDEVSARQTLRLIQHFDWEAL